MYRVYLERLDRFDPDRLVWATARSLHVHAFHEFYTLYEANVWGLRSRGEPWWRERRPYINNCNNITLKYIGGTPKS